MSSQQADAMCYVPQLAAQSFTQGGAGGGQAGPRAPPTAAGVKLREAAAGADSVLKKEITPPPNITPDNA